MNQEEHEQNQAILTSNQAALSNAPFMIMRLDTAPLIDKIHNFLSSQRIEMYQDKKTEEWKQKVIRVGLPLANVEGIMRICNIVEMRINYHIAQGNFDKEHYWDFIGRARKEITETIIKKCYDWDILDNNLNMVIDEVCALLEGYLTRPIDNKERESYSAQFQSKENTVVQQPRSAMQSFGMGMGRS